MPSMDLNLSFHQVAKHYYFPGWHEQSTVGELLVNRKRWQALSEHHKSILKMACGDSLSWSFVLSEALQYKAVITLKEKGMKFHRWPDNVLEELEASWNEVIAEQSAKDPLFKRVHESYAAFRSQYTIWRQLGYLE